MHRTHRVLFFGTVALALALAGCAYNSQTTSGIDYLARIPSAAASPGDDIDQRVRQVANVEPILRFPARIGLARIGHENYRTGLVPPPAAEAKAWLDLADDLGPEYGEFVPISPLIAAMLKAPEPVNQRIDIAQNLIETIRLAAARQHLDAVLIYEVDATADSKNNPLSIADWTLIGAFVLPSQNVKAQGVAQAMLIDVRNGYPYGTIQAKADDKTIAARFANREAERDLSKRVEAAAVENLTHDARNLMRELKVKLVALDKPVKTN